MSASIVAEDLTISAAASGANRPEWEANVSWMAWSLGRAASAPEGRVALASGLAGSQTLALALALAANQAGSPTPLPAKAAAVSSDVMPAVDSHMPRTVARVVAVLTSASAGSRS